MTNTEFKSDYYYSHCIIRAAQFLFGLVWPWWRYAFK